MIIETLGTIDGDHLQTLARQTGVPELCNSGPCPDLRAEDMPSGFDALRAESVKLAAALVAADPAPLVLALQYAAKQSQLASKARDLLLPVLQQRRDAAEKTLAALRETLMPKAKGVSPDLAAVAVNAIVDTGGLRGVVENALHISSMQTACNILRDRAADAQPRWLKTALAEHESAKRKTAAE